ncbi:beta-N-acetylhexosaminidase [Desertivirga xinjiangensis]|uniref:beta-N-acetylhexosaminidase n=1 Tax=Desertivirga xinjiangensis TaxID=539206 RepID=UPI00210B11A6|nr:family 20 glycosylhydrolase [Pedobacter xinjiangensis]
MKKFILSTSLLVQMTLVLVGQTFAQRQVALIPVPVSMKVLEREFEFKPATRFVLAAKYSSHQALVEQFALRLRVSTGLKLPVVERNKKSSVVFVLNERHVKELGEEGYGLKVSRSEILISANSPKGWFYAFESLMQLLPAAAESSRFSAGTGWKVPCLNITDYPAFSWRGLMLDVSRHFFSKEVIKSYINQIAKYKLNTFHFHLTDNQGWRVELKGLPLLTKVGAWHVPRTGYWNGFKEPEPGEAATDGGFYSLDDVKEIISYAADRFVTVVPEIDVPGHSLALIASYPNLSCTKTQQQVLAGDPWNISRTNVLCVGNDSTYQFLDKLFEEVASLFPSEYIHIGGDEVTRTYWKKCAVCQKRIKEEGLKNEEGLQRYFLNRVAKIVQSKGKKVMGWYENLDGDLDTSFALISWKDMKGGKVASVKGHKVVMAPAANTYLDFYQNDVVLENGLFSVSRLTNAYNWDLSPFGVNHENVLGGQGCLWTEQVANERKLQYMTFPRAIALSEVFWSPKSVRGWDGFIARLEEHLPRLDSANVNYSKAFYEPIIRAAKAGDSLKVDISNEIGGLRVFYSFDDTDPDRFYPEYRGVPLEIPKGAHHIRVVSYKGRKQMGRIINLPLAELNKRIKSNN